MRSHKRVKVGDIVSCRFPQEEAAGKPGLKQRPCIVVGVSRGSIYRPPSIEVVFGTGVDKKKRGQQVRLHKEADLDLAGLIKPTNFILQKRARVPLNSKFIISNAEGDTALGHLPQHMMDYVTGYLNAENTNVRDHARRYGRRQPEAPTWTNPSASTQNKEGTHA